MIYVKASEPLVDLLTFMGAPKAAMQLMELKMVKDVRNKTNRIINCETANLSKMAAANAPVNKAVRYLEEHGDLAGLRSRCARRPRCGWSSRTLRWRSWPRCWTRR